MQGLLLDDRAAMGFSDLLIAIAVLLTVVVTAPFIYTFGGMASAEADPLTGFLIQLIPPLLILSVIVSAGIAARGGS